MRTYRLARIGLVVGLSAAALPASAGLASARPEAAQPTVAVTITNRALRIAPDSVPLGTVLFRIANRASIARDFRIAGKRTTLIAPGKSRVMAFVLSRRGPYAFSSRARGRRPPLGGLLTAVEPCTNPVATTIRVQLAQDQGGLTLSQVTAPCGTVTFLVTNTGPLVDRLDVFELELPEAKGTTKLIAPGQTASLTLAFTVKGSVVVESAEYPPAEPEFGGDFDELARIAIV